MPIYEYKCPHGHVFERFQRITEPSPEVCDECGEGPVQRVLYPVAVHFKGSGFYSTDYGRGSRKKDAAARDGSEPSTDKGGDKPEKKEKTAEG